MSTSRPTPEQGLIEGRVHRLPLRVYYEDTDAGGIVYHAGYLRFAERARTEMLRCLGCDHATLRALGLIFAVRRCMADFLAPARLDDRLVVETRLAAARARLARSRAARGRGGRAAPGAAGGAARAAVRRAPRPPACRPRCATALAALTPASRRLSVGRCADTLLRARNRPRKRWWRRRGLPI